VEDAVAIAVLDQALCFPTSISLFDHDSFTLVVEACETQAIVRDRGCLVPDCRPLPNNFYPAI
jgi:hypothetical protein